MGDASLISQFWLNGVGAVDRGDMIEFGAVGLDGMIANVT